MEWIELINIFGMITHEQSLAAIHGIGSIVDLPFATRHHPVKRSVHEFQGKWILCEFIYFYVQNSVKSILRLPPADHIGAINANVTVWEQSERDYK